ncbi:hypothetical protein HK405_007520, partial [Cladochytrium tenue]
MEAVSLFRPKPAGLLAGGLEIDNILAELSVNDAKMPLLRALGQARAGSGFDAATASGRRGKVTGAMGTRLSWLAAAQPNSVTACVRIYHSKQMDYGDLFQLGCLVCFRDSHDACLAVLFGNLVAKLSGDSLVRRVVFHPPPPAPAPLVHGGSPSCLIYVRLMRGMSPAALAKILKALVSPV